MHITTSANSHQKNFGATKVMQHSLLYILLALYLPYVQGLFTIANSSYDITNAQALQYVRSVYVAGFWKIKHFVTREK